MYDDAIQEAVLEASNAINEEDEAISAEEELLASAIENLYDNLSTGISLYEALELDMALRAAIAVSADLGHAIDNLSTALVAEATLSEAENLVADVFIDAYEESATMIIYLEGLAEDEADVLDKAIQGFYKDVEDGETYTEALEDNLDLIEAIEVSSTLEDLLVAFVD